MALDPWYYAKPNSEHSQQTALFMWANMAANFGLKAADDIRAYSIKGFAFDSGKTHRDLIPQLKWLHAIHNQGHGDKVRGAIAKAEGVKAGVFDMFLPVPIELPKNLPDPRALPDGPAFGMNSYFLGCYCGLYLEMKTATGKPSTDQLCFQQNMRQAGYKAEIAYGWLDARDKILDYLQISS